MSRARKQQKHASEIRVVNLTAAPGDDVRELILQGTGEPAELIFEALAADDKKLPSFTMAAYNGGPFFPGGWYERDPIIIDLAGMEIPASVPIDSDHAYDVGHTNSIDKSVKSLKATGVFSAYSPDANDAQAIESRRLMRMGSNKFPFQASITPAVQRDKIAFYATGQSVRVNGRTFDGPVYVAGQSSLKKIAILSLGADATTQTTIAAKPGSTNMNPFDMWLSAEGFDPAIVNANAKQKATLEAAWKKVTEPPAVIPPVVPAIVPAPAPTVTLQAGATAEQLRAETGAEINRINGIRRLCAAAKSPTVEIETNGVKSTVDLEAHAVLNNWALDKVELKAELFTVRTARPAAPAPFGYVASGEPAPTAQILEAALCMTRQIPGTDKAFDAQTLETASRYYKNCGLQQTILTVAAANGYHHRPGQKLTSGNLSEVMRYAMMLTAAPSTLSLPGILGAVANKEIRAGYDMEPALWRMIAQVKSVANFYTVTSYRLLDNMEYEELGPAGQIKHGSVAEESYTRQAKTYAKMFSLTRTSMINDDLNAFDELKVRIGRGGAQKLNRVFWLAFLNNSSFFTSARGNYITGATTTLLTDGVGLELGLKAFSDMKSPAVAPATAGYLIGGEPSVLMVPSILSFAADRLYTLGNANGSGPDNNIHKGRYKPLVVSQLGDSSYTNYSTTAWYLLRDAGNRAVMNVSFLDGNEMPTVESSEAEFSTLGMEWRGYHDFGCDQAEYTGGLKSKGTT